ncbi:hypothetical protein L2E82_48926 [Cichorium intybus]|uniref:Uncharacterized protein n=1 Tax=Cichorium intybus TaxID=13427 RepID=A0ACB8YY81_CICIN|nr:hypothetical protein L2E82_48926 [Cichorium intybus]
MFPTQSTEKHPNSATLLVPMYGTDLVVCLSVEKYPNNPMFGTLEFVDGKLEIPSVHVVLNRSSIFFPVSVHLLHDKRL